MTDCKGLFGKLFGHQFDKFLVKEPTIVYKFFETSIADDIAKSMIENNFTIYEIRCKRCGAKADE
jgi:hypothetical protein